MQPMLLFMTSRQAVKLYLALEGCITLATPVTRD